MAELIPPLASCISRMQAGEKRFARRLISHLEDDYLCWYETGIGHRPRYTDFVILHPMRGLLLLEVKDWRIDTIRRANPNSFELLTNTGLKTVANPQTQVRQCSYKLVNQLERDPQLIQMTGDHKGKLVMPYGYGVVFSNITRAQFEKAELGEVIPEVQTLCKDEMAESTDVEAFQKHLWDMFNYRFHNTLTQPQIDRVRWHLFPEIRMNPQPQLELSSSPGEDEFEIPDIIKVMDLKQEKLARGMGEGHRIIHGVAGSGKTMILGYRCLHLAKLLHKPILVLCYNVTLAARLRSLIEEQGVTDKINVYSIHRWANTMLKSYNFKSPKIADGNFDAAINTLIEQVNKGHIPRAQYGAVLIDEGHDFKKEWLRLIWMGNAITGAMKARNIPFTWLRDTATKRQFNVTENSVKIVTMHSSKGLEFSTVATCGVGSLGIDKDRIQDDAKLLYVAMTRATQNLLVTSSNESPFAVKLQEMIEKHRAGMAA